jgi:hypothetical protein
VRAVPASKHPPAPVVARYDGVLSLTMERSQFVVVDDARARTSRSEFTSSPGYSSAPHPSASASIRQLLIGRLLAVLEFGSDIRASSLTELEQAIDGRWGTQPLGRATDTYERVTVEGLVRADGTAEWGYTIGGGGRELPISRQPAPRSEFELYIQNQMRADLMRLALAA